MKPQQATVLLNLGWVDPSDSVRRPTDLPPLHSLYRWHLWTCHLWTCLSTHVTCQVENTDCDLAVYSVWPQVWLSGQGKLTVSTCRSHADCGSLPPCGGGLVAVAYSWVESWRMTPSLLNCGILGRPEGLFELFPCLEVWFLLEA